MEKGTSILHYRILEKIGKGGMGLVYKAHDTRLDRIVALKFISSFEIDDHDKERLLREAKAAASLSHNNIATVHEIGENEGQPFIVMEYYKGITLQNRIKDDKLGIDEVLRIVIQVCNGLQKAHENNIIHRDIKPANIIITEDDEVKIIDFGLAKIMNQTMLTKSGTTLGTVSYMSPEQIQGATVDHRTDIWSLGVILYEMLAGERPFHEEYEHAIMYSITNEEPEYISKVNPDVSVKIEKIIKKALQKDSGKRFNSIKEMEAALLEVLKDLEQGTSFSPTTFKLGRKQKKLTYKIAAVFLVAATIVFLFRYNQDNPNRPVTIALLPLENLSNNSSREWFSDGLTDALITDLARISGLRIISRSSVMRYKETDKTISEIALELGVDYLIEGSVLEMDNKIRINTRLIDARQDEYLWAEEYFRDLTDIFSLQGELAEAISAQIQVKLTPFEYQVLSAREEVDPEAYEAYLRGNYSWFELSEQALETAENYYKLAIEIDPEHGLSYAGIALTALNRAQMGYSSFEEIRMKAENAAQRALQIDSTLAEVHYMLGVFNTWMYRNWNKADEAFSRAIELNPNYPEARAYYSHLLFFLDRPDEAMKQIESALAIDPYNPLFKALYSMDLMYKERYDDVIAMMEENLHSNPGDRVSLTTLRSAYHQKGLYKKAIEIWRRSFEVNGDEEAIQALMNGYNLGGYEIALRNVAELFIKRSDLEFVTSWQIGTLYTRAGMEQEAIDYLEKAYEENDLNMPYLSVDPIFNDMRDNPRFVALIDKMGL